jgi:hypothetical protein
MVLNRKAIVITGENNKMTTKTKERIFKLLNNIYDLKQTQFSMTYLYYDRVDRHDMKGGLRWQKSSV